MLLLAFAKKYTSIQIILETFRAATDRLQTRPGNSVIQECEIESDNLQKEFNRICTHISTANTVLVKPTQQTMTRPLCPVWIDLLWSNCVNFWSTGNAHSVLICNLSTRFRCPCTVLGRTTPPSRSIFLTIAGLIA